MVSTPFDALAQAAFASSQAIFAVNSPTSQPARSIERLSDKFSIASPPPHVTTLQANADPFQKIQVAAAAQKELTAVLATSDVLLPAIPHLFKAASQRSAVVLHIEARERDASNNTSNSNSKEQQGSVVPSNADLMAVRQTGFAVLTSDNTQAAFDLGLVAQAAAVHTSTPFLNAVNASSSGSEKQQQIKLDHQKVAPALITDKDFEAHKERQAAVSEISLSSLYLNPKDNAASALTAASPEEIYNKVEELLAVFKKQTGRSYSPIEYQGKVYRRDHHSQDSSFAMQISFHVQWETESLVV
jgi:pyruvate/2-oxoacid:ferredoxin oxidoreductase alpha subunit